MCRREIWRRMLGFCEDFPVVGDDFRDERAVEWRGCNAGCWVRLGGQFGEVLGVFDALVGSGIKKRKNADLLR